jgi:hypothetical protein
MLTYKGDAAESKKEIKVNLKNGQKTDKVAPDECIWEVDKQLHAFLTSIQHETVVRFIHQTLFSRRKRKGGPWSHLNALEKRKIHASAENPATICWSLNQRPNR